MKRILIFIVVGLIMFGVGFGGGLVMGRNLAEKQDASGGSAALPEPGPMVALAEFTSNLAGSGRHVISFTVSLEALNAQAAEVINSPGWLAKTRDKILLIVKDKIYEDLTSAEGALQFAQEIKRTLNSMLPSVKGDVPVVNVLFESFVLQ